MINKNNIPKHGQIKKLADVCTYSKGKKPLVLKETSTTDCSVPYINIKAFEKGIISEYTNGEKCNICNDDDLLMVWDGARCGLIGKAKKGAVGSTLMKILPKENIDKEYLYHFISSKYWTLNTKPKGVGIPHIEPTLLWNFELVVPPLPEQQAIVAKIEELFSELENGKQQLLTAQQQLKVYRQSLLKCAFEGKLTNKNVKEGELPKGWKIETLGNITHKIVDGTHHTPKYTESGVPFVSVKDIRDYKIDFSDTKFIAKSQHLDLIKRCNPEMGDILITKSGTIGRLAIVPNHEFSLFVSVALLKINKDIIQSKYALYALQNHVNHLDISSQIKGGVVKNYHLEDLRIAKIILAPFEKQSEIVSELESKLTVCDKIEKTIAECLQQAETLKQSILKKAFEGRLI